MINSSEDKEDESSYLPSDLNKTSSEYSDESKTN